MSPKLRQLKALVRKDLVLFTQRPQYRLYVVLLTVLVAYSVIAGVQRFRISVQSHQHWSELQEEAVNQIRYAPSLKGPGYTARFPPALMSVFAQGADDLITVPFVTRAWTKQQIGYFTPDGSITRIIPSLDFVVLVLLLGGLFTIWLCHDFVLQEIQNRTVITNVLFNVSPRTFITSKVIAMILGTTLPTLILFTLSAVAVPIFSGQTADSYSLRCLGFVGILLLYQSLWIGIALLVQSFGVAPRTALIYGIGAWILIAFVIPNLSMISDPDARVEAYGRFMQRRTVVAKEKEKTYIAWRKDEYPPTLGGFEPPTYQGQVEKALLDDGSYGRLLEATSEQTRRRLDSFGASAVSPYTAAAVAATEFANTGLGTYVATRADMLEYHKHYHDVENTPEFWRWATHPDDGKPVATIKKLEVKHKRPLLERNAHDARIPALALLLDVLLLIPLGIILMERRLGIRRSAQTQRRLAAA